MREAIFGRLTLDALPDAWYTLGATISMLLMVIIISVYLTRHQLWSYVWNEWLTSTDPKKIGVMYIIVATLMLFRGLVDAGMLWLQQSIASGNQGYLYPGHFQEVFTSHGDIMVFFVTMGYFFGFMNIIVPLQIGARDLAFPFLNSLSFWLNVAGAALINTFFVVGGHYANTGWLAFTPLSETGFNPGAGVDYLIWSLQISGLGSLLTGINLFVTIVKKRAPGMTLMKMPLFTWNSLCSTVLIISAFPVITATLFLLWLDRYFGMHFFTATHGGNQMMYFNLIWMWGHPEVYILVIPAFGMFSEIVATFSNKTIYSYYTMVAAAILITLISYLVWLHHFFTMGGGPNVNAFFGIMTLLIAIPMGVQMFNWIMTMYRGKVEFTSAMHWFIGFIFVFTIGGMAGILMASPPADFQIHNSLFLVAHFHTTAIGAALFGIFAGLTFWFPKIGGYKLDERLGKMAFWIWIVGFFLSFTPLYLLGLMGATRRLDHYSASTGWQPLFITSLIGFAVIVCGIGVQIYQYIVSYKQREANRDETGDPWNGRTLEWSTSSPPLFYNFAVIPQVTHREEFRYRKQKGLKPPTDFEDIELPKNTGLGIYISALAYFFGFGFVWHIPWLTLVSFVGMIICLVIRSLDEETEYTLTAKEVEKLETAHAQ